MCVSCSQSHSTPASRGSRKFKETAPCDYTKEQVELWKIKVLCVKTQGLLEQAGITSQQLNGFLGVINSIVTYNNNPCTYSSTLEKIFDLVMRLTDLGLCQ